MQSVGDFCSCVDRHIPVRFKLHEIHAFECIQQFAAGEPVPDSLFQVPVDGQRQEAGQEMGGDPVFPAEVDRPCVLCL